MFRNYIFDLYGTLADIRTDEWSESFWEKIAEYYSSMGADYTCEKIRKLYGKYVEEEKNKIKASHPEYTHIDIQIENVFKKLFTDCGIDPSEKTVLDTARFFRTTSREFIKLYDGIEELLTDLKKSGGNVYLLTNAQRAFTWEELELLGIIDKFDGIVISSDEGCCKPDPCFFKKIIDKFDLDPASSIMTGNDPTSDIRGAKGVGMSALYIHTEISPEFDESCGADFTIPNGDTLKMRKYLL